MTTSRNQREGRYVGRCRWKHFRSFTVRGVGNDAILAALGAKWKR
jgi:hypothetical protein